MTEESKDSKCFVAFCDVCGVLESAVESAVDIQFLVPDIDVCVDAVTLGLD